jgi:predicted acetyltransferase
VPLEVRTLAEADRRAWFEAIWTSFGEDVVEDSITRDMRVFEPDRMQAIYDGTRVVGGGAVFSYQLTVPGGACIPVGGVTAVGILPTHRRQGGLRQLMLHQLNDARRRGEAAGLLWASEGSIYQRFGYGLASLSTHIEIDRERATFRGATEWAGTIRLVDAKEATAKFPPVHDAVGRVTPGFWQRNAAWWESQILADPEQWRRGSSRKFFLLNERDGEPVGYAMYRIKSEWGDLGHKSTLNVIEWAAVDAAATQDLWRYLFGVDLIAKIAHGPGPVDHPLLLMVAEPRRLAMRVGDGLWLRLVDVRGALAARSYNGDGDLVIDVVDDVMPDVAGRWRLAIREGRANVSPSQERADLRVDITDLGAVYLGGFTFAWLAAAGRGTELTSGAIARADRLFTTDRKPWSPHVF